MDLPIIYHQDYVAPLPPHHRFPMAKFEMLYQMLLADGVADKSQFHAPELPPQEWIELVHDQPYVQAYCNGTLDAKAIRRIGLPWSLALANRTRIAVAGTILTAKLALECGLACNTAGGTHHAFPGLVRQVLIIDLDVHQGDGTAVIFQNDSSVFTFSMHCEVNFPGTKQQSDLDVHLSEGIEDDEYLQTLAKYLPDLLSDVKPDLVLYDAGVDPHQADKLGKLALTDTGLFRREMQVLSTCCSAGYPVACVIGGGYSDDMNGLVYRHSLLHRAASQTYRQYRL
jgi:acetoin utilization deacetylase AcuC-like enzyme